MSLKYSPSDGAQPDRYWGPKFLSNRDITGQAPIDKTTYPGVNVTAACFSDRVYDSESFQTCFSNLIAVGFRRLTIDLYWSVSNQEFQLCPVSVPELANSTQAPTSTPANMPPRRQVDFGMQTLEERQTDSANATSSTTSASSISSSNGTASTTTSSTVSSQPTTDTGDSGSTLIVLGQYSCSTGLTLDGIIDIIDDYIAASSDAPAATLQILEINLHSARPSNDPDGPPRNVTAQEMPSNTGLVGYQFDDDLGTQLYTPGDLAADRSNLNASWFQVRVQERLPMTEYFNTTRRPDGTFSTDDGWPNELYLLLTRLERVIITWGTIAPEMMAYDFEQDGRWIFPSGYLTRSRDLVQDSTGIVTSGCFYDEDSKSPFDVNNTWAVNTVNSSNTALDIPSMQNMTSCGITPYLNTTLDSGTANSSFEAYQRYTQSLLIGWAPGEPTNASSPGVGDPDPPSQYRCAVLDSSDAYRGKWRVVNCQSRFRAACRVGNMPYNWRLTTTEVDFTNAPNECPDSTTFDIPVTQLENTYLYEHVLADVQNASNTEDGPDTNFISAVYINLNSLDSENCWVTTGPNGTCRYQANAQEERNRQVLIPTIAALIILILTVLTILVKCNVNRRNNKRHRVGPGGWEYEGVPS